MTRNRVTLRDVARRAGVHPSTVSRVLNPATRTMVSAAVSERVRAIADEMDYHANPFALSLKTNRSHTVGVLVPDIANPMFPPLIRAVQRTLGEAGYSAVLADSDHRPEQERVMLEHLRARQVDGLVLATAHRRDDLVRECLDEQIPLVLVNRVADDLPAISVTADDLAGTRLAVDHLLDLGHRHIALVVGPQTLSTGYDRHRGFVHGLEARGLAADPELVVCCESYSETAGQAALDTLIDRGRPFTGVVAGNDLMALGCYAALEARGMACPRDLSVTGYNDMPFADRFHPPLTSVRIDLDEMGAQAARMLLALLDGDMAGARSVRLEPTLVVRGSTGRPAGVFG